MQRFVRQTRRNRCETTKMAAMQIAAWVADCEPAWGRRLTSVGWGS
jgi:hypothetical protein